MLESNINLALIDPAKWGWSAGGKVVQLLTPHEDLRRRRRKARGGGMASKSRRTLTSASSSMSDSGKSPGLAQLFDLDGDNTCDTGGTNINSMSNSKSNRSSSRSNKKRPNLRMKQPQPQQPQQSLPVEDTPRKATTACSSQHPTSPVATPSTITPTPTIPFPHHSGMSTSGAPSPLVLLQKQQQQQQLTVKTLEESSPEQPSPESSLLPRESTTRSAVTVTSTATTTPAAATTTSTSVTTPSMEQISLEFKSVEIRQGKPNELIVNALVSNNATTTMTSTNKESDETNDTTTFVDMYTYHLGREGLELCDEPDPVDTGCNAPLPRTKFPIQVEFPLDDDRTEMWTEQIEWDLEDEKTLTPMAFATQVAHDFGLNFGDTMELASSIQEQLNAFRAAESSSYPDPAISLNDPSTGLPRSTIPPNKSKPCYLYGWTDGSDIGGMPMVIKKTPRPPATPTATIAAPAPVAAAAAAASIVSTSSTKVSTTKTSERNVNSNKPRSEDLGYQFKTPIAFREEVIKRAKLECRFPSRNLQLKWNHVCHLCDTKKQQGAMLPCENPLHIYCLEHAKSELKIDLSVPGRATTTPVDYCPICCCSCSCRTCQKRLDQVAYELQRRSVANGGTSPQDTKLDHILLYCAGKLQPNRRKSSGSTTGAGGGKGYIDKLKVVPKAPLSDFPMEMCGSRNMEPGSEMDYRTVFTQNGAFT
ncbi:bromodomain-containing protein [Fragilaria crotonensis]|nr:bromodomain-containing protein [Fragilaria crotonensis]